MIKKQKKGFAQHHSDAGFSQNTTSVREVKKKSGAGFTLIELLVVIAVIGMISSIVLVALGPVRARSRDTKRIAEVRQLSLIFEQEATDLSTRALATPCNAAYIDISTCVTTGFTVTSGVNFTAFKDPSTTGTSCKGTASGTQSTSTCQYSVSRENGAGGATVGDYQICFYLEQAASGTGLVAGLNSIYSSPTAGGGNFRSSCK
ncbi:MAG: type II secretion system protein [Candidatus Wildermuthbacteria bacterium]|nr:type II secretion system protein [Candidatus Wildermuthbacteria bacterium]